MLIWVIRVYLWLIYLRWIDRRPAVAQQSGVMKPPRFLLRGFRRPSDVASTALGHLERQTIEEIWRRGETSVRDMFRRSLKSGSPTQL